MMADKISGLQAEVERLGQQLGALQKTIEVEKLGQQLDALQTTMDKARETIDELRKDGINQVDASTTECDDLDDWEVAGASIADQMELKVDEKCVKVIVKVDEKAERAATMKRLLSLAPKVKGCTHAAQMVNLYGNQNGRGIRCTKCGLKVFEKNSKGDDAAVIVVTLPHC
jgi:DNA-directed RNA polymerase subunit RPC12/RpoP